MLRTKTILIIMWCVILEFPVTVYSQVIDGLLIEGLDYSGKTTIAKLVKNKLEERNYNVKTGHGQLAGSDLSRFLAFEAYDTLPAEIPTKFPDANFMEKYIKLKLSGLVVDKMLGNQKLEDYKKQGVFLIQDRYLLTLQCTKRFFTPNLDMPELKMIEEAYIPFKYNIYLTCSSSTRKKRVAARGKEPDRLEKYLIVHFNELYKYDELCQSMVKEKPGWYVIDTSNTKPEEVANQILDLIEKVDTSK